MATQWYLKSNGNERGPVQLRELIEMARAGVISPADQVRSTHHKDWQPAATVLQEYFPRAAAQGPSAWSETVSAAVAARRRKGAESGGWEGGGGRGEGGGLRNVLAGGVALVRRGVAWVFGWLLAPVGWLARGFGNWLGDAVEKGEDMIDTANEAKWIPLGIRAACGVAAGGVAAMVVRDGSAQLALQNLHKVAGPVGPGAEVAVRYFPVMGECSPGEYWFMFAEVVVVAAAAGWFAAGWLLRGEE